MEMDLDDDDITSLEELCVQVIAKEFSRITMTGTNDPKSQLANFQDQNLQFLRKFYSKRLLKELIDTNKLKEDHLDFLLNEYLKEVKITELVQFTSKENLIKKLIPIAHSLDVVSCDPEFFKCHTVKEMVVCVDILKQIIPRAVSVSEISILVLWYVELLQLVASSCPQITRLGIYYARLTDISIGLKSFYANPDGSIKTECLLKYITLILCDKVRDEEIAGLLENVPSLEEVTYIRLPRVLHSIQQKYAHSESAAHERKKLNLTRLQFFPPDFDLLKPCSDICPNVTKIRIDMEEAREIELRDMFPKLNDLDLRGSLITVNVNNLLMIKGKNLKVLSLEGCELSVITLLENCVNLEVLKLHVQYQAIEKHMLKTVTRLKTLRLTFPDILNNNSKDSIMVLLNFSPNLCFLAFEFWEFRKYFDSNFVEMLNIYFLSCKLKMLAINHSSIDVEIVQQWILRCNSLRTLILDFTKMSMESIHNVKWNIIKQNRRFKIKGVIFD